MDSQSVDQQRSSILAFINSFAPSLGLTGTPGQAGAAGGTPASTQTPAPSVPQAGVDWSNADSVSALAKQNGWADPKAFSLDMLTGPGTRAMVDGGYLDHGSTSFKDDVAAARGITNTGRNRNIIRTTWDDNATTSGPTFWDGGETTTTNPAVSSYKVLGGAIPGQKRHTSVWYEYDKDGKFKGANIDTEEKGLEGAAPLLAIAAMALTAGGASSVASGIGGSINSSMGFGLGQAGQAALGNAAVGVGNSVLMGQNPIKGIVQSQLMGAATNGISSAVGSALPSVSINPAIPAAMSVGSRLYSIARSTSGGSGGSRPATTARQGNTGQWF